MVERSDIVCHSDVTVTSPSTAHPASVFGTALVVIYNKMHSNNMKSQTFLDQRDFYKDTFCDRELISLRCSSIFAVRLGVMCRNTEWPDLRYV